MQFPAPRPDFFLVHHAISQLALKHLSFYTEANYHMFIAVLVWEKSESFLINLA